MFISPRQSAHKHTGGSRIIKMFFFVPRNVTAVIGMGRERSCRNDNRWKCREMLAAFRNLEGGHFTAAAHTRTTLDSCVSPALEKKEWPAAWTEALRVCSVNSRRWKSVSQLPLLVQFLQLFLLSFSSPHFAVAFPPNWSFRVLAHVSSH